MNNNKNDNTQKLPPELIPVENMIKYANTLFVDASVYFSRDAELLTEKRLQLLRDDLFLVKHQVAAFEDILNTINGVSGGNNGR